MLEQIDNIYQDGPIERYSQRRDGGIELCKVSGPRWVSPGLELKAGGVVLLAPPAFLPSVISFFTQSKGGRATVPSPGSRTVKLTVGALVNSQFSCFQVKE